MLVYTFFVILSVMFWFGTKKNTFNFSVSLFLQTVYMISVMLFFFCLFRYVRYCNSSEQPPSFSFFFFLRSVYSVGVDDGGEK